MTRAAATKTPFVVVPVKLKKLGILYVELDPKIVGSVVKEGLPMELLVDKESESVTLRPIVATAVVKEEDEDEEE
jgi:hypothetical protein